MDEWINMWYIRIYKMDQYSIVRKDEILSFAWIDPKRITLNDINQMEKDKHHRISLICGLFKKQRTDKPNIQLQKAEEWLWGVGRTNG